MFRLHCTLFLRLDGFDGPSGSNILFMWLTSAAQELRCAEREKIHSLAFGADVRCRSGMKESM